MKTAAPSHEAAPKVPVTASPAADDVSLSDVADLIYAAEDLQPRLGQLASRVLRRDPETAHLYRELEQKAHDCGVVVGSPHWSLSTVDLNAQLDRLLDASGRDWQSPEEILGVEEPNAVDLGSLVALGEARLARCQPYARTLQKVIEKLDVRLSDLERKG